jgi:hypothetical protein
MVARTRSDDTRFLNKLASSRGPVPKASRSVSTKQVQEETIPEWRIEVTYVESCNCNYGCPCNFSGFPSFGFCRALVLYSIGRGHYGDVKLDGLNVVEAASWPKAIHEGDGTMRLYISEEANRAQRDALVKIFGGEAKGNGSFAIFRSTLKYFLEPKFVKIKSKIDGKKSSFSVPGELDVQLESFTNPVTGEESDTEINVPKGFIFKVAQACKTKVMRIVSPNLSFDDSGKNAFFVKKLAFNGPTGDS